MFLCIYVCTLYTVQGTGLPAKDETSESTKRKLLSLVNKLIFL